MRRHETVDEFETHHAFVDKLRGLLRERYMLAKELAEQAGISKSAVSRLLAGKRRPSLKTLARIARVFDMTSADLWGDR